MSDAEVTTMSPLDRRTFLKTAAVAGSAGALAPVLATQAHAQTNSRPTWKRAPCPLCSVGCGLLVGIQNGRAVSVKGDPASPVSEGLACVKGYHVIQALYARDRIRHALIRRNGVLTRSASPAAFDLVATRLRDTVAHHGRDSVAWIGSAYGSLVDSYLAAKLFKGAIGTSSVDTDARLSGASASAGLIGSYGEDGAIGCYDDVDHADLFVIWNENLAETSPVLFSRILKRRRTNPGVMIVDVSTRTTRTSYAADRSFLFAPQTDLTIANAIAHELIARRLFRRDFVERYVSVRKGRTDIGADLTGDALVGEAATASSFAELTKFLEGYSAERAQQLSGMRAEDVRWLAALYGDRSRRVMTIWGETTNQQARGTWVNNALHNIHLLTGRIATPGNAPLAVSGRAPDAGAGTSALPRGSVTSERERELAARLWGVPASNIGASPGRTTLAIFRAIERGDIRFLWVQSADPLLTLPHLARYRAALKQHNCFVVVSATVPNSIAEVADVVLPTAWWIEREGVQGSVERRVQYHERMLQPPDDVTSEGAQLIEVARRLGYGSLFPAERDDYVSAVWEEYARFRAAPQSRLPALGALQHAAGVIAPVVEGRETRWRYSTEHDPAADGARGEFDFYGHADHRAWLWLRPHQPAPEQPDQSYPFWLTTGAVLEHSGTGALTRRVPTLHRAVPRAYAELNSEDARALGVRSGDRVRIESRRGALELEARIDQRSQPQRGQVFIPSFDEDHPVHRLTLDACCPLSGQPASAHCAVRVARAAAIEA